MKVSLFVLLIFAQCAFTQEKLDYISLGVFHASYGTGDETGTGVSTSYQKEVKNWLSINGRLSYFGASSDAFRIENELFTDEIRHVEFAPQVMIKPLNSGIANFYINAGPQVGYYHQRSYYRRSISIPQAPFLRTVGIDSGDKGINAGYNFGAGFHFKKVTNQELYLNPSIDFSNDFNGNTAARLMFSVGMSIN